MAYNYMRQILNENKIPHSSDDVIISGPPDYVVLKHICHILECNNIKFIQESRHDVTTICGEIYAIDLKTSKQIGRLKKKYANNGVNIVATSDRIIIEKLKDSPEISIRLKKINRIKSVSFESDSEDEGQNIRYTMEYHISQNNTNNDQYIMDMRHMLPQNLKQLFDVITNTPEDFTDKFGTTEPSKKQMAQYLNVGIKDIEEGINKLKYHYMAFKCN
jgi:hypothetical protein